MEKQNKKTQKEIYSEIIELPRNEDLERYVLGSILFLGGKEIDELGTILTTDTFYNKSNSIIFRTILDMYANNEPISTLSVAEKLRGEGKLEDVGGAAYLSNISSCVHTTTDLSYNAKILHQHEIGRKLYEVCERGVSMVSCGEDVQDIMEHIEKGLTDLNVNAQSSIITMHEALADYYAHIQKIAYGKNDMFVQTGFSKLDDVLGGGFHNSDLIVFGGRPGNGKTAISLHFAKHVAEQGKKVLFVNIEMTTNNLIGRLASDGIAYDKLRTGNLSEDEFGMLEYNLSQLNELPIYISSDCNTFSGIVSKARQVKRKEGLDFMVIDYLQLIELNIRFERRQLEVGYMTRRLKALAKELDIPILLLSQLSRPASGSEERKPRLENLRESGDIEQDADVVLFTHRPNPESPDDKLPGKSWFRRGQIIVAKNREGERDVDVVYAHDQYFKKFLDDGLEPPQWECGTYKYTHAVSQDVYGKFGDR